MKKKNFKITIEIVTGLHIGIGSDRPEIGGVDNPFIKDPISHLPYIPGSSLKGKLRSLLETESTFEKVEIEKVFEGDDKSPTRVIFRDVFLTEDWRKKFERGEVQTEIKTEIKINRERGTTQKGTLRSTERIPPTTQFEGDIIVRYSSEDDFNSTKSILDEAVKLLNNDYLGGSGSRGYGAVKVILKNVSEEND